MKKVSVLIFVSALLMGHQSYAEKEVVQLKAPKKVPKVRLNGLEFEQIIKALYKKEVIDPPAHMKNAENYPQSLYTNAEGQDYLLTMLPILKYQDDYRPSTTSTNLMDDDRADRTKNNFHLVIIQKNPIYDGYIQACRACSPDADFHIFREQELPISESYINVRKRYPHVKSKFNVTDLPGSDGELSIDFNALQNNLQPFGQGLMGSYYKKSYMGSGGIEGSNWYALHLNQQQGAQISKIAQAGNDNRSYYADRPKLATTTTSTLQVINNGSTYYPLKIQYKTNHGLNKKAEITQIQVVYDEKSQEYIE